MSRHSPWPWTAKRGTTPEVVDSYGRSVALVSGATTNAALIATAPELLDLARQVMVADGPGDWERLVMLAEDLIRSTGEVP